MQRTAVIERYLALIADPDAEAEEIRALLEPDMRFVELPNLFNPNGSERDPDAIVASLAQGRELVRDQRFDVVDHVVGENAVATRVVWTGTMAVAAGPFPAGARLRADSFMRFTFRGGRIARQENYDCFHPPAV
jgi:ketosteroid isomerase-like protein